jgi:zinc protease
MSIGIAGSFTVESVRTLVERRFGDWPRGPAAELSPVSDARAAQRAVALAPQPIDPCRLIVGHLGVPAAHPDWVPLQVLHQILAADPVISRLPRRLESDHPSVRAVRSRLTRNAGPGVFSVEAACAPDDAAAVAAAVLSELRRLQRELVSPRELADAVGALRNSFVFRFDTLAEVVDEHLAAHALGLPPTWLVEVRDRIARVTAEEVRAAAQAHLRPDAATLLAVGPADPIARLLAPYGRVRTLRGE